VYQCLALCAANTKKIKLGTNVTNPLSRIAPVTACNVATLNQLAPGRVIMGIGTGNTARRALGMPAARLAQLRHHVEVCRGLLHGESVPYEEGDRRRIIQFLDLTGGWINLKKKIPIYVAASGPKALELAGEIGDGVILFGTVGDSLLDYALSHIRTGAKRAGKTLKDLYIVVQTAFHVVKPYERLEDLQQAIGPYVCSEGNILALSVREPQALPGHLRSDIMAFRDAYRTPGAPVETRHLDLYRGYVLDFKPEHASLVTEQMIRETTLTGTPDELVKRVKKMRAAGVKQIAIHGGTRATAKQMITDFAKHVIAKA
jgi:alkanesulfonate monooxygenase SsuD/methylene tetrahydromethanopterin reductase-like flavin-dependent oxidoreductase (luciferase family)